MLHKSQIVLFFALLRLNINNKQKNAIPFHYVGRIYQISINFKQYSHPTFIPKIANTRPIGLTVCLMPKHLTSSC